MADPQIRRCRIPELLVKRGKTQLDLAIHLGVTEAHISKIVNLKGHLSFIKSKKTADFLGCLIDDLFEWKED